MTYVKPVDRFMPARNAETGSAVSPLSLSLSIYGVG
jgi:hypothetical protein